MKKASDLGSELGKHAQKAAGKISEATEQIADTAAYKKVSEVSEVISETKFASSPLVSAFEHHQRRSG